MDLSGHSWKLRQCRAGAAAAWAFTHCSHIHEIIHPPNIMHLPSAETVLAEEAEILALIRQQNAAAEALRKESGGRRLGGTEGQVGLQGAEGQ